MADTDAPYLILSFDGGGIRGLVTALLLQQINSQFPDFLGRVNLFAGTSTGSFIALGLGSGPQSGITPDTLVNLYATQGPNIFQPYSEIGDTLDYVEYYNDGLKTALENALPTATQTLSELAANNPQRRVMVTTFQLFAPQTNTWLPLVLHNLPNSDSAANTTIIDAAMSSSAAPTYFPPYPHPYYGYCVDGGVVANNPSTLALSLALDPTLANVPLGNIRLLSLGTGAPLDSLPNGVVESVGPMNYGVENWMWPEASGPTPALPLMTIMFDGVSSIDTYQCQQLLGAQFQRGDVPLPSSYPLDDWQDIDTLTGYVNTYLGKDGGSPAQNWTDVINWIGNNFPDAGAS